MKMFSNSLFPCYFSLIRCTERAIAALAKFHQKISQLEKHKSTTPFSLFLTLKSKMVKFFQFFFFEFTLKFFFFLLNFFLLMSKSKVSYATEYLQAYWWSLSDTDKYQYSCLRLALAVSTDKNQRNQRITSFKKCIDAVNSFAVRGDGNDLLRSYVCGIIWLPEGIAVNTHYLKALISKCKSSINGSLQKMGYTITINRVEAASIMASTFPGLKENTSEIRKWSIRKMPSQVQPAPQEAKEEAKSAEQEQDMPSQPTKMEDVYPIVASVSDPELFHQNGNEPSQNSMFSISYDNSMNNQQKTVEPLSITSNEDQNTTVQFEEKFHYDDYDLCDYHDNSNYMSFYTGF